MTPRPTSSHNAGDAARKPLRLGLWIPWGLAVLFAIGWSIAWLWLMDATQQRLDAEVAALKSDGWRISWDQRTSNGYPFRLDVAFTDLHVASPTGLALALPQLKTEAFAFAPAHWMLVAPAGLTLSSPSAGSVRVGARALRASVSGWQGRPPHIDLEGDDLTFVPQPGSPPFPLASADTLQFDTRPAPGDAGQIFLGIDHAAAQPGTWLDAYAKGQPVNFLLEVELTHAAAFTGPDWGAAVRRWSAAGGALNLHDLNLGAGPAQVTSSSGAVTVAADGRWQGALALKLAGAVPRSRAVLSFANGQTLLDGIRVGPAPRAF